MYTKKELDLILANLTEASELIERTKDLINRDPDLFESLNRTYASIIYDLAVLKNEIQAEQIRMLNK